MLWQFPINCGGFKTSKSACWIARFLHVWLDLKWGIYLFLLTHHQHGWLGTPYFSAISLSNYAGNLTGKAKKMVLLAKRNLGLHDFFHDFLRTWLIDSPIFKIQMSVIKWVPCFSMILRDSYTQHYPVTWRMPFHVDNCGTGFFSPTRQLGLFVTRGKPFKWHHGCQIWNMGP